jgi:Flp pilus assembly secretin CpaC
VLGGLTSDRKITSDKGVPLLADIPLLGVFFRRSSTSHEKRNLMIVLVPYVVQDAVEARQLMERKMRERQEFETSIGVLDEGPWDPHVDYGKKRGLVEEINHQVTAVDRETAETLREAAPVGTPATPPTPTATPQGPTP